MVSRRTLLLGAAGAVVIAGGTGAAVEWPRISHRLDEWMHPAPEPPDRVPTASPGGLVSGSFMSQARGGITVRWAVSYPPGSSTASRLPMTLVLHGRGDDAGDAFGSHALGIFLAAAVDHGLPPYALAAIDGGESYWHRRADGDDPQRMILHEFLPMLARRGLRTDRIGLSGWSMGGYGALLLAERLGPRRCAAVAADSPALWTAPGLTAPGAFDDAADYERNDVFAGRPRLRGIPIRIAIGTSDPFYAATRSFVSGLPQRPQTDFSMGGHELAFWHHAAPADIRFLGRHLHA